MRLVALVKNAVKTAARLTRAPQNAAAAVERYWTGHNVTLHRTFSSPEVSLADFHWRNAQYFGYIDLMPVAGADGLTVLDFGCGPGYDLVGFASQSRPRRLIGIDVSQSSLAETRTRLALHGAEPELHRHDVLQAPLPLSNASVDLVHSSGVLHHMPTIEPALKELRRVLKPGGRAQFMVYHTDSLWLHLYVAYERQLVRRIDHNLDLLDAFQKINRRAQLSHFTLLHAGRVRETRLGVRFRIRALRRRGFRTGDVASAQALRGNHESKPSRKEPRISNRAHFRRARASFNPSGRPCRHRRLLSISRGIAHCDTFLRPPAARSIS